MGLSRFCQGRCGSHLYPPGKIPPPPFDDDPRCPRRKRRSKLLFHKSRQLRLCAFSHTTAVLLAEAEERKNIARIRLYQRKCSLHATKSLGQWMDVFLLLSFLLFESLAVHIWIYARILSNVPVLKSPFWWWDDVQESFSHHILSSADDLSSL